MVTVSVPCDKSKLRGEIDETNFAGIYTASLPCAAVDETEEVRAALRNPIGSLPLAELAKDVPDVCVIASDHTRPVPSRIIMPELLKELRRYNPSIRITILIATGFHRETTKAELIAKFGEKIVEEEKIVVHDSSDQNMLAYLGTLPSGGELSINRLAAEASLLVSEGFIEPHFFAGFSGGRKSVLPGIAARETVFANHCAEFINDPHSRTGILDGNPIHRDMLYAAEKANLRFILNVVIDPAKRIVRAFAGDMKLAHQAGCDFLKKAAGVNVPESDIAITSNGGYPLDQNVYQCVKSATAGEAAVREGGCIIVCAGCRDGHGGESFYRMLSSHSAAEILAATAATPRNKTIPDQWQYQILARIMQTKKVIFAGVVCDKEIIRTMGMDVAGDLQEAIAMALDHCGSAAKIAVIPEGVSVIVKKMKD